MDCSDFLQDDSGEADGWGDCCFQGHVVKNTKKMKKSQKYFKSKIYDSSFFNFSVFASLIAQKRGWMRVSRKIRLIVVIVIIVFWIIVAVLLI